VSELFKKNLLKRHTILRVQKHAPKQEELQKNGNDEKKLRYLSVALFSARQNCRHLDVQQNELRVQKST